MLEFETHVGDLTLAGAPELSDFIAARLASGLKPTSARTYLGCIRPFYKWAGHHG